jgi:hypothetical protein
VDYSLFIIGDDIEDIEEGGDPSEAAPGEFPPPIFAASASVLVLGVSVALSSRETWGVIYIGFFGQ